MAYRHMVYGLLLNLVVYLLYCTGGKCEVVKICVGDGAVLPCEVDPTKNPTINRTTMAIEWSRPDLHDRHVHFHRIGKEFVFDKIPSYNNRTSLFKDEVMKGNMSLKLSNVTSSDEGTYACILPEIPQKLTVQLIVAGVHASDCDSTDSRDEVPTDGGFPWWGYPIIILGVILVLLCVLGYRKRQDFQEFVHSGFCTPETPAGDEDRSEDVVSELTPMNEESVDKPVLEVVNESPTTTPTSPSSSTLQSIKKTMSHFNCTQHQK